MAWTREEIEHDSTATAQSLKVLIDLETADVLERILLMSLLKRVNSAVLEHVVSAKMAHHAIKLLRKYLDMLENAVKNS